MKRTQTIAISSAVVAVVAIAALFLTFTAEAPAQPSQPSIAWTPSSVSETVLAGESKTISATFEASSSIGAVDVWVAPELQPYVTVSPQTFSVADGQSYSVDLTISTPIDAFPITVDGTVHLRKAGSTTTVAKPLPMVVALEWPRTEQSVAGFSFAYPTLGQDATITSRTEEDGITFADVQFSSGGSGKTQYAIAFVPNNKRQTLLQWFAANVDLSGAILATGGYSTGTLPNGVEWLEVAIPIPQAHLESGERIAAVYGMSADYSVAVAIHLAHENDFSSLGVASEQRSALFRALLGTLVAQ